LRLTSAGNWHRALIIEANESILNGLTGLCLVDSERSDHRHMLCAQLMHTQGTDFKTVEMALEPGLGVLMGASSHLRAAGSAATLHSLRPSPGYLALQGALALPPPNSPPQANQQGVQVRHCLCRKGIA